jgi:diacylglycerol kinase family enzyme
VRALLIVNPSATSTTPGTRRVITSALERSLDLTVVQTQARGHATELAAHAAAQQLDLVVALGGDGTVNEIVNGLMHGLETPNPDAVPALGIVPGGNANVMARALGIPADPVEATGVLMGHVEGSRIRTRQVGLGRADERWFTFSAGIGLDAEVVAAVERARASGRHVSHGLYVRRALAQFLRDTDRSDPALTVLAPGRAPVDGLFLAIVQNTAPWTYLGPRELNPSPRASFDKGLDLFALSSLDVVSTLRYAQQMLAGQGGPKGKDVLRLHDQPRLELTARRPIALQVDGDHVGAVTQVVLRSVPRALRVVA